MGNCGYVKGFGHCRWIDSDVDGGCDFQASCRGEAQIYALRQKRYGECMIELWCSHLHKLYLPYKASPRRMPLDATINKHPALYHPPLARKLVQLLVMN